MVFPLQTVSSACIQVCKQMRVGERYGLVKATYYRPTAIFATRRVEPGKLVPDTKR